MNKINMKLIKLENHYYVIDDSEIKIGDWFYFNLDGIRDIYQVESQFHLDRLGSDNFKITHSTNKLEGVIQLNLADVEESIYGYSVNKMAEKVYPNWFTEFDTGRAYYGFIDGFKACQDLMKDTININIEDFKKKAYSFFSLYQTNEFDNEGLENEFERVLQVHLKLLLPKTEWEINIIDNKIKIHK